MLELLEHHPHSDADTIARQARTGLGKVSTQAIYDVLSALTGAGLVRRIEPAGSPARYELRVDDNHHHLVCRDCGTIVDVDCAVGDRPCLHASHDHGFEIDEAEVIYWGRCPTCRADRASRAASPARLSSRRPAEATVPTDRAQRHTTTTTTTTQPATPIEETR